jgi:glutathionylspermidine synthase
MKRINMEPRANWRARVERVGLAFHTGSTPYWNETACYELTLEQA